MLRGVASGRVNKQARGRRSSERRNRRSSDCLEESLPKRPERSGSPRTLDTDRQESQSWDLDKLDVITLSDEIEEVTLSEKDDPDIDGEPLVITIHDEATTSLRGLDTLSQTSTSGDKLQMLPFISLTIRGELW